MVPILEMWRQRLIFFTELDWCKKEVASYPFSGQDLWKKEKQEKEISIAVFRPWGAHLGRPLNSTSPRQMAPDPPRRRVSGDQTPPWARPGSYQPTTTTDISSSTTLCTPGPVTHGPVVVKGFFLRQVHSERVTNWPAEQLQ